MADNSPIKTFFHEIPQIVKNWDFRYVYHGNTKKVVVEMLSSHNGRRRQVIVIDASKIDDSAVIPIVEALVYAHNKAFAAGINTGKQTARDMMQKTISNIKVHK